MNINDKRLIWPRGFGKSESMMVSFKWYVNDAVNEMNKIERLERIFNQGQQRLWRQENEWQL